MNGSNKNIFIGIGLWALLGFMVFTCLMLAYIKYTQNIVEKKIDKIHATLEQWELTK